METIMKVWNSTPELAKPLLALAMIFMLGLIAFFIGKGVGVLIYM